MQMKYFRITKLALCDDQSAHMVPLPTAEPAAINAFMKITRLTLLQAQDRQISDNCKQPMHSNIPLLNQTTEYSHQSQDVFPHDQSRVILQQFSIITQALHNFTDKVSGDLNKIT